MAPSENEFDTPVLRPVPSFGDRKIKKKCSLQSQIHIQAAEEDMPFNDYEPVRQVCRPRPVPHRGWANVGLQL